MMSASESDLSPLHIAAWSGDIDAIRKLLKEGKYDANCIDSKGQTPLHFACTEGCLLSVEVLMLEFNADQTLQDIGGRTALMLAAATGNINIVQVLLKMLPCPLDAQDNDGWKVLHYACLGGNVKIVSSLILNHQTDDNTSIPLLIAANNNKADVVLTLIQQFGYDPDVADGIGQSLLHKACEWNNVSLVQTLMLDCKANYDQDTMKNTPLHVAACNDAADVVLALIQQFGCNPNEKGQYGRSLLHHVCMKGNISLLRTLVQQHKADIALRDNQDNAPIHVAAYSGKTDVVLTLISEFGCDPNERGQNKKSLLHIACLSGNVRLVQALIQRHKVDVHVRDDQRNSVLFVAADNGKEEVALTLIKGLKIPYDPNETGQYGRSLLHHACIWGKVSLVQTLLTSVPPSLTDDFGDTPLHLAAENDRLNCVQALLAANAPLFIRNNYGQTPVELGEGRVKTFFDEHIEHNRDRLQVDYSKYLKHAKKRYSGSHHITRVFVIGNPGAGKSSFIETLKRESFFESLRKVSESSVPLHTAGIIPSVHLSKRYGRIMFYDFAGDAEYYSSHAAIFESLASSKMGDNLFIFVVDLRKGSSTIEATLHYWFSFIQYQKFNKPFYIVVGSHYDCCSKADHTIASEIYKPLQTFSLFVSSAGYKCQCFMLDCRKPRSKEVNKIKKQIFNWISDSPKYKISSQASILLGLLEKDFSAVTACPIETLAKHIETSGAAVLLDSATLHSSLVELHEVGVLLLLGERTRGNSHLILKISQLTNTVHKSLFAQVVVSDLQKLYSTAIQNSPFDIGIISEDVLQEILPPYITKEYLIHLQYCQQINHADIDIFLASSQSESDKSFLFFPALCCMDKSQVTWNKSSSENSFSIGWLGLCTEIHDYFPSRFLHVLLLRLVYAFTLSAPAQLQTSQASSEYSRRCTMWKRGVHWLMEQGVYCMVELLSESKGVVVFTSSANERAENCIGIFNRIISCVMEAKAEFCYSIKPQFFLLDSTAEEDYLNKDHMFAMSDVEKALSFPEDIDVIVSVSGRGKIEHCKLLCMRNLTHWNILFPIEFQTVLHLLQDIVNELYELGEHLGAPRGVLQSIEADFPTDVKRRRRELVRWWMSSSPDPPCWFSLVQALKAINENALAEKIMTEHNTHFQLQKKLLIQENQSLKPDMAFMSSFSIAVGSTWPSLAVSLSLNEEDIIGLKEMAGFSQQELALFMLALWTSKENVTYGQLCYKLKAVSLFQH